MQYGDVAVTRQGHVAILEIQRPPNNFFDVALINSLGDAFDALDADTRVPRVGVVRAGQTLLRRREFRRPHAAE